MRKQLSGLWIAFLVAVVWGYFSDLRNGEIGWFIGRIIFMVGFAYILNRFIFKSKN